MCFIIGSVMFTDNWSLACRLKIFVYRSPGLCFKNVSVFRWFMVPISQPRYLTEIASTTANRRRTNMAANDFRSEWKSLAL